MKSLHRRKIVNHKRRILYFSLFFVLLFISVGYAYLNASLSITGHTELLANTWDIHFANLTVKPGSVTPIVPATIQNNSTSIDYSVVLSNYGEFYEFEVDVVNSGTLPGKISMSEVNGISNEIKPYISFGVLYDNDRLLLVDDIINPGSTKRIKVSVEMISPPAPPNSSVELNLTYNLEYTVSDVLEVNSSNVLQNLLAEGNTCITPYTGQVTDRVGVTETATNVYFDKCANKRNVIFAGFCWQVIRSTQTGGLKMIYNGEPENGKCESSRGNHIGFVQSYAGYQAFPSNLMYGSSFYYDEISNMFYLSNTEMKTFNESTYKSLLGKFTCKNTSGNCSTLYSIASYSTGSAGNAATIEIGNTNYAQIGTSSFNSFDRSPAMVGYMYNEQYIEQEQNPSLTGPFKFGSTFTYSNGTYTLAGTTYDITNFNNSSELLKNAHYTCWNANGVCSTLAYLYSYPYYINLNDGKGINDALSEMLWANNVNTYNSTMKGIIDSWYDTYLYSSSRYLEDTVYCNARNVLSLGGWNPNGGIPNVTSSYILYKNNSSSTDLSCLNETDQFAVSNVKAQLTYPVGLLGYEEYNNIGVANLMKTSSSYWTLSPERHVDYGNYGRYINSSGSGSANYVTSSQGIRPVISIAPNVLIEGGDGSEETPWLISSYSVM